MPHVPMKRFLVITKPRQSRVADGTILPTRYQFYSYRNVDLLCATLYRIGIEDVRKVNGRSAHVTIINLTDEKVELE